VVGSSYAREIMFGEVPYRRLQMEELIKRAENNDFPVLNVPEGCGKSPLLLSLMKRCLHQEADQRPSFLEILKELKSINNESNY
jgi:hypothetical protein